MLTGLLFPTSGEAYILGKPAGDVGVRQKTGYLPENFKYQEWMTGEDLLSFHASLYRMDKKTGSLRIKEVLEITGLKGSERFKIGTYSKGMQQRIGIASSLLSDPEVLFLDEPSSALDPVGRKEVRDLMLQLRDCGKTIFLNSHLLSEVETICDSIAIIKNGSIIRQGSMEDILEGKTRLHITTGSLSPAALAGLKGFDPVLENSGESIEMNIAGKDEIASIAKLLIENGCSIYELVSRRDSLESLFINVVKGED
jgi:ABC-2 type transport system ATP-binding protein